MRMLPLPDTPGVRFRLAVAMLRELARARGEPLRGLGVLELAQTLRTNPLQVEPLLDTLVDIDWVGRLDEPGGARYVLLCDPQATPAQPLLAQLLAETSGQRIEIGGVVAALQVAGHAIGRLNRR